MDDTNIYLGLEGAAKFLGVPFWRIRHAHVSGHVPEPRRIANRRIYDKEMLEVLRQYFDAADAAIAAKKALKQLEV